MRADQYAALVTALRAKESDLARWLARREGIDIQTSPDTYDEALYQADRELAARSLQREYASFLAVRRALARVANQSYGICLRCDREIGYKRLLAVPWASCCIQCQEILDTLPDQELEEQLDAAAV